MNTNHNNDKIFNGLHVAVATPITEACQVDQQLLQSHCKWLLEQHCDGLCFFGTTGEGTSLSLAQRIKTLQSLLAANIPPSVITVGCGVSAVDEGVTLLQQALALNCTKTLALPPFFFKTPTDDGLLRFYSELIERIADDRLQLLLYNIPALSGISLSYSLIEQLTERYPQTVIGVKDSSGNWGYTQGLLTQFPQLSLLVGVENHLPRAIDAGAAGTISGLSNISPRLVEALLGRYGENTQMASLSAVNTLIELVLSYPLIPAIKGLIAYAHNNPAWRRTLAPLITLTDAQQSALLHAAGPALAERLN